MNTPLKTFLLENTYAYVALKLAAVVGCVAMLGVIAVLSLELVDKFRRWK
jgi:hypothetical protein